MSSKSHHIPVHVNFLSQNVPQEGQVTVQALDDAYLCAMNESMQVPAGARNDMRKRTK